MLLLWHIDVVCTNERKVERRLHVLATEALDVTTKAKIEYCVECENEEAITAYRNLFEQRELCDMELEGYSHGIRCVGPTNYYEDEKGERLYRRIPQSSLAPIPLENVSLTEHDLAVFSYFLRDCSEIRHSAFREDGPGSYGTYGFESAVTDDEVRSFVTSFRRLYMTGEPACLKNAVDTFVRVNTDHPLLDATVSLFEDIERQMQSVVECVFESKHAFTSKRLIDVFIYTQYAHQPLGKNIQRQKQYEECLAEVNGNEQMLTWMFVTEIWRLAIQIGNVERIIKNWFQRYCEENNISPDYLASIRDRHSGFGAVEKKQAHRRRVQREKIEELARALWNENGQPHGGWTEFLAEAEQKFRT